jgi:hypothetical protein
VVLSHHGDQFDRIAARDLDHHLPIITGPPAARKLHRQGFRSPPALSTWESRTVSRGDAEVRVTSLPGQHTSPAPIPWAPSACTASTSCPAAWLTRGGTDDDCGGGLISLMKSAALELSSRRQRPRRGLTNRRQASRRPAEPLTA